MRITIERRNANRRARLHQHTTTTPLQVPAFRDVSFDARVAGCLKSLGYEHPLIPQSMYIFKQPSIGGAVEYVPPAPAPPAYSHNKVMKRDMLGAWLCAGMCTASHFLCTRAPCGHYSAHQDGAFLYTRPQSVVGLWWALEDCTKANGCLWAVPGSHRLGVHRRFKRRADGGSVGTVFEPPEPETWDLSAAVPLEIPAGDMVLIHSAVVHFSAANTSDKSRHAYSIHVVEGGKGVEYPADNWLQRPAGEPFPAVY